MDPEINDIRDLTLLAGEPAFTDVCDDIRLNQFRQLDCQYQNRQPFNSSTVSLYRVWTTATAAGRFSELAARSNTVGPTFRGASDIWSPKL